MTVYEHIFYEFSYSVERAVYLTDTKYRIKQGNERFKETIPEIDYIK